MHNEKYLIVAVDQQGNEVGLESYAGHIENDEVTFECKSQARSFYNKIKEELFPHSVKLLTIKES
ncbi:hypothetical protein [Salibacterium halotolerans]|uniref:Uncharacterized protein n=1 Tax=Salibacterium halotolerans TaxID=1884432 RepID=A0A1I5L5Z9_9BACI|nr:hypothetical protein [Salibacterium halotolerans]SFO92734.1 hypothetical protein SAMN05518683_101116 [Salibacterium halotolerans]